MKKNVIGVVACIGVLLVVFFITPIGRAFLRDFNFMNRKMDETSYNNRKQVEDSARAMIANYTSRVETYKSYNSYCEEDNFDQKRCDLAISARLSANNAASVYNEYLTKNSFIWRDNIPDDLPETLEFIQD